MTPIKPFRCTMSGIDPNTDITKLLLISLGFPFVEWQMSYNGHNEKRMLNALTIAHIILELQADANLCVAFFGTSVTNIFKHNAAERHILESLARTEIRSRVQLNHTGSLLPYIAQVNHLLNTYPTIDFIFPHNDDTKTLCEILTPNNYHILLKQIKPKNALMTSSAYKTPYGYSDNIGLFSVRETLDALCAANGERPDWIHINENSLRSNFNNRQRDVFDPVRAGLIAHRLRDWLRGD